MEWYIGVLKKYAVFSGRARRKEYWMFFLFNCIVSIILGLLGRIPGAGSVFGIVSIIYSLALIVPSLAVAVRRLHDTNRSGWMFLLILIPLVGAIIVLVFSVQDGTPGDNKFGPNPKGVSAAVS
ncbi:MAG: DUF805 domain-containing protein [Treponema sp.]|nr:DUF805 domain-containing protein [Treponema sp.]